MGEELVRGEPELSIIVPVYNVEKYLPKCIESILNQTFKNFELLLIDDGSTDSSGEICEEYARKDKRIQVIHQHNGGLSSARNTGLRLAKGKYIGFVDSDDWIHGDMYGILLRELEEEQYDIAICRVQTFEELEEITIDDNKQYTVKNMNTEEGLRQLFKGQLYRHGVCNKVYKKATLENIEFPIGKIYEDNFITYKVLANAKKIKYIDKAMYYYFQRPNSILHKKITTRNLDIFDAGEEIMSFTKENYRSLYKEAQQAYVIRFFDFTPKVIQGQSNQVILEDLQKRIKRYRSQLITNKLITIKQKVLLIIYTISIGVYKKVMKI